MPAWPHRLDDTDGIYVRVGGAWRYLYRAVDGTGQTIDFLLSAKRDKKAAKRFFRQALGRENTHNPREIVTDRLKSYPGALRAMKREGELWRFTRHRRGRWINNLVEQDHRGTGFTHQTHSLLIPGGSRLCLAWASAGRTELLQAPTSSALACIGL